MKKIKICISIYLLESRSTGQVVFSNGVTALSEHPLSMSTDTVSMAPYFQLSSETSAEKNILGPMSIHRTNNLVMDSPYKTESRGTSIFIASFSQFSAN